MCFEWCAFGVLLGCFCNAFGILLGCFGGALGMLLGCFWAPLGMFLGRFGGSSIKDAKIVSPKVPQRPQIEAFWDHFGTILDPFWKHFFKK